MEVYTICDDNGIEMLVDYDQDDRALKSVEIVIAGVGIDLTNNLCLKQREFIISKIEK